MRRVVSIKLDGDAERVRLDHERAIGEIQAHPSLSSRVIAGVSLANGVSTAISHGLSKPPSWVGVSPPRGATSAGYITELRPTTADRTRFVYLQATGFGATVVVDVRVEP